MKPFTLWRPMLYRFNNCQTRSTIYCPEVDVSPTRIIRGIIHSYNMFISFHVSGTSGTSCSWWLREYIFPLYLSFLCVIVSFIVS